MLIEAESERDRQAASPQKFSDLCDAQAAAVSSRATAARARGVLYQAAGRISASRQVGYDGLLLQTRLLEADIRRVSQTAGKLEQLQLTLGLHLLSLEAR